MSALHNLGQYYPLLNQNRLYANMVDFRMGRN